MTLRRAYISSRYHSNCARGRLLRLQQVFGINAAFAGEPNGKAAQRSDSEVIDHWEVLLSALSMCGISVLRMVPDRLRHSLYSQIGVNGCSIFMLYAILAENELYVKGNNTKSEGFSPNLDIPFFVADNERKS